MDNVSNFWTRKQNAQKAYTIAEKKLDDFYIQSASTIKNKKNPQIAKTSYNKRNFQEDLQFAVLLQDDEKKELIETIKSEVKIAPNIIFPCENMTQLLNEVNSILQKTVTERVKVKRIDNSPEKREFAKRGLKLHKKGEACAFCGNEIKDDVFDELENYFSADEVKEFQTQITEKIESIDLILKNIDAIQVSIEDFYKFIRFQSNGTKTQIISLVKEDDDFKTSYESLWLELKLLYEYDITSADMLLNPIRRIIETFTKFNALNKTDFCNEVAGAKKLFDVNSHSIDDIEAELNGKNKQEVIQMLYDCFSKNDYGNHFLKYWKNASVDETGKLVSRN